MDFATLPPEVNSGRMYTGPGAGPMLAAAQAWEAVAGELYSTANSYQSVVSGLTAGPWLGPSSVTMAAAAASHVAWLTTTAVQADETAGQARAAAAAYETAFAATVPPEEVAANRSLLATLVATNLLGQNTPAIAATEAQYGEMWAQDIGAMFGYAGSSASATALTPFSSPRQTTNAGGSAGQESAAAQAGETSAGSAQSTLSQVPQAFSSSQAPSSFLTGGASTSLSPINELDLGADLIAFGVDAPMSPIGAVSLPFDLLGAQTGLHTDDIVSAWAALGSVPGATVPLGAGTAAAMSTTVYAGLGEANAIGALSVPPTWAAAAPAIQPIALALPAAGVDAQAMSTGLGGTFGEIAMASTAARAVSDTFGTRGREPAKAAGRQAVSAEGAPPPSESHTAVTEVAAGIREFAKLRDEGLITHEQFVEQRKRLLEISHP
jgi:PPE-repeat protein